MGEINKNIENLRNVLQEADSERMDFLHKNSPFDDDDELFLVILAAAIPPDFTPADLANQWKISFSAAAYIMSRVCFGAILMMDDE